MSKSKYIGRQREELLITYLQILIQYVPRLAASSEFIVYCIAIYLTDPLFLDI